MTPSRSAKMINDTDTETIRYRKATTEADLQREIINLNNGVKNLLLIVNL